MPAENIASAGEFEEASPATAEAATTISPEEKRLTDSSLFWLILLLIVSLVVPFIPVPNRAVAVLGAIALTVIYVVAIVNFAAHMTRLQLAPARLLTGIVVGIAVWAALQFVIAPALMEPLVEHFRATRTRPEGAALFLIIGLGTFTDLTLLFSAVCAGSLVARLIQTPNMLGPVCGIIAMIDIWGVLFGGIVSQLMVKTPHVAAQAMAKVPTVGAATSSKYVIPLPDIGVGDYLFLGLLFAALHLHHMNWRSAMRSVIPLVCVALLAITAGAPPLPGLFFIGLGVALPNREYFKYTREEKFALLYAGLFVIVLTIGLYFGVMSMLPDKPIVAS